MSIFVLVSGHNGGDEGGNDNGHGHSQGHSRPGGFGSHNVPVRPQTDDACQNAVPRCDISAQYRNITGACNNIKNPFWGSANIGMRRYLAADYEDGVGSPKQTDNLPLARIVSTRFHPDKDFPSQLVCHMYCNIFKLHRTSLGHSYGNSVWPISRP